MNTNICLRKLEEKDIPGMLEWMHDPEINRWFRFDAANMTEEKARDFIQKSFTESSRHYAISDETGEYFGTASIEEIDHENGHALFAITLRSRAIGTGAGSAATQMILQIAFGELGLQRVYSNILADNIRSRKLVERNGFRYEGCFRSHLKLRGEWRDLVWYSILRDEYNDRDH